MTPGPDAGPPAITAQVADGTLLGKDLGDGTHAFLGVPYAAPPVGRILAVAAARRAAHRRARRDAEGSECPQSLGFSGAEQRRGSSLPQRLAAAERVGAYAGVRVHPCGAFAFGSGGGANDHRHVLAKTQNVIAVTINDRLGALGFMALAATRSRGRGDPSSGSYGIEDQSPRSSGSTPRSRLRRRSDARAVGGESPAATARASTTPRPAPPACPDVISASGVCSAFANTYTERSRRPALRDAVGRAQSTDVDLLARLRAVDPQTSRR